MAERKEYGKAALTLVTQENARRKVRQQQLEDKARQKAEQTEDSITRASQALELAWEAAGVSQHHQHVVKGILQELDEAQYHQVCVTEIQAAEQLKSPSIRIDKYFGMRSKCIEKLKQLDREYSAVEADDQEGLQHLTSEVGLYNQTYRRLLDLRKLTFAVTDAVLLWEDWIISLPRGTEGGRRHFEYLQSETGRSIAHDLYLSHREVCSLALLRPLQLNQEHLFVLLVLDPGNTTQAELYHYSPFELEKLKSW